MLQDTESSESLQHFQSERLQPSNVLRLGQLENGFRYVMMSNKLPPDRFEAHLEMHVGMPARFCMRRALANQPHDTAPLHVLLFTATCTSLLLDCVIVSVVTIMLQAVWMKQLMNKALLI